MCHGDRDSRLGCLLCIGSLTEVLVPCSAVQAISLITQSQVDAALKELISSHQTVRLMQHSGNLLQRMLQVRPPPAIPYLDL